MLLGGDVPVEGGWLPAHPCLPPGMAPGRRPSIAAPAPGTGTRLAVHCTLSDQTFQAIDFDQWKPDLQYLHV